jgi:hypothetical protein
MSKQTDNVTVEDGDAQAPDPLEAELEAYPLREATDDPRWAVRTAWTWVGIATFLLLFLVTLLILGLWFD